MTAWERYPPADWYRNTVAQSPVRFPAQMMIPSNTGYQQHFFHIPEQGNRVIRTPFFVDNWSRPARSPSWNKHFQAVPYNSYVPTEHGVGHFPPNLQWPQRLVNQTGFQGTAQLQRKWWIHPGKQVATNIPPFHQRLLTPKVQLHPVHCEFEDQHTRMELSSTGVRGKRKEKNQRFMVPSGHMPPTFEQDKLSLTMKCPGRKKERNNKCLTGLTSLKPPESFWIEKKTAESNITSEVYYGWDVQKTKKSEFIKHNPNPNGR